MPLEITCPFKLCVASSREKLCNKSECELWSTEFRSCSFVKGMQSISSLVFEMKELISELREHRLK